MPKRFITVCVAVALFLSLPVFLFAIQVLNSAPAPIDTPCEVPSPEFYSAIMPAPAADLFIIDTTEADNMLTVYYELLYVADFITAPAYLINDFLEQGHTISFSHPDGIIIVPFDWDAHRYLTPTEYFMAIMVAYQQVLEERGLSHAVRQIPDDDWAQLRDRLRDGSLTNCEFDEILSGFPWRIDTDR